MFYQNAVVSEGLRLVSSPIPFSLLQSHLLTLSALVCPPAEPAAILVSILAVP
jgi:hypothetical protein